MLVSFQFPIADARPFVPSQALRRPLPDWPDPATSIDPQFVHHFGQACERLREPDEAWPDEIKYCRAKRGLRFDRLETRHAGPPGRRFRSRCAFRRLFSDGQAVLRVEIGLTHNGRQGPLGQHDLAEILGIAGELAELPTVVPVPKGTAPARPLASQGKHLARLYAEASTSTGCTEVTSARKLVEQGEPLILIELDGGEAPLSGADHPKGLTQVAPASVNGAIAIFCRLQTRAGIVSTWILQQGSATKEQLRSLRLCLTRLHAEREVLELILKQIHRRRLPDPPSLDAANLLDRYFNDRLKIVERDSWGGMKQSEITAALDATLAVVRPASQAQLVSRYEGSRKQVWQKISAFQEKRRATRLVRVVNINEGGTMVEKHVNVSGTGNIVNVAEYMANVTNTVNNNLAASSADQEVKELIQQLAAQIEGVAQKADPNDTKKLGKNLEALSKEVASDEPERRWYEFSLGGLKEAAQAIGDIASPILTTVGKLAALLLA